MKPQNLFIGLSAALIAVFTMGQSGGPVEIRRGGGGFTGITTNNFNPNQFNITGGTNVAFKSDATVTNLTVYSSGGNALTVNTNVLRVGTNDVFVANNLYLGPGVTDSIKFEPTPYHYAVKLRSISNGDFGFWGLTNPRWNLTLPYCFHFGWASIGGLGDGTPDTALYRNAAGVVEINNGTNGVFRDLVARDISATNLYATNLVIGGGTAITKVLSAIATLDFDLTAVVVEDLTITVTGAASGDVVTLGVPNGSITTTVQFIGWVSAADTVTVRARTAVAGENPASGTFRATVIKH